MLEQCCVIYFGILYFHQRNLVCNCYDEFEQVNSGWLISYVFNCFGEIKETYIEFVINIVSAQGNVKIKLNVKVEEIYRDCSPNFFVEQVTTHHDFV